jgi:hypothetical protein
MRGQTIEAIASMLTIGGEMLLIGRGWQGENTDEGPPWPLKEEELNDFHRLGFAELTSEEFWDENNGYQRIRKLYKREK